jgi:hypothetical protein
MITKSIKESNTNQEFNNIVYNPTAQYVKNQVRDSVNEV